MASLIRWKRGDYVRLGQSVARFNKMLAELDDMANNNLPEGRDYKVLKESITTRSELNRVIKSLNRATKSNLTEQRKFASGEEISKWEFSELNKAKRRALRNLAKEKQTIIESRESIGMGDERLSEIRAIEDSFDKLDERTGAQLDRLKQRIFSIGRSDYKMVKDKQFMENFYTALEGAQNFQNYDVLLKELKKIKNPTKFYEYVKQSPVLMDIFLWYKADEPTVYGGFDSNEDAFDSSLMFHLGLEVK